LRTVTETQWFLGRVNGFEISNKRYAFILHENISEYKDKEIQNLSKQTQIPTLLETVKSVISMLDLQELLNTILKKLEKLIHYNAAGIFTYEGDMLIMQAYQGPPISDQPPVIFKPKGRYSEIQRIISTSHSFYIENINEMPGLLIEISDMLKLKIDNLKRFHSWLFLPMIFKENGIGIMVLSYHKEAHYDHDALRIGQLFSNYAAIAIQNAHLYELSQHSGVLKERNRLAFELHDSIAQLLFSINLYANAAQKALTMDKLEITKSHLNELQNLASDAVREMRLMIFELNDQLLDEFNIIKALQARFNAVEAKQRIKTELNLEGDLILPRQIEGEVYGIIQDIITYIGEITSPQKISLDIVVGDDQVLFNIISDSTFDSKDISLNDDFEKINRIRSRIRKIGGSLKLDVSSTIGTVINFNLII
jgi:signal transduction histidine kinase